MTAAVSTVSPWPCRVQSETVAANLSVGSPGMPSRHGWNSPWTGSGNERGLSAASPQSRVALRVNQRPIMCRRLARQEVLWSANTNLKKVIHIESDFTKADFGALAFVRFYVWPVLVKVVRNRQRRCAPGGSVCGSTVDEHKPDRDLALKDCAPGSSGRKFLTSFDSRRLVDHLQHP